MEHILTFFAYRYEENYFTRLPVTRQDRHRSRQLNSAKSVADELIGLSTFKDSSSKKRKAAGGKKKKGKYNFWKIGKRKIDLLMIYNFFLGGFNKKRKHWQQFAARLAIHFQKIVNKGY